MAGDAYLREHPNPVSRGYTSPRREEPSGVVAVHTAENAPDYVAFDGGAEAVAQWETIRTTPGSYHDLVDSDSAINLVRYADAAWHDGTGTNHHSYGLSVATRADVWPFAPPEWRAGAVEQAAQAAARYARWLHARNGTIIPARRITAAQARARVPGFVTHAELDPKRRTDPGASFPWDRFLARYAELVHDLLGLPGPNTEETTMDAETRRRLDTIDETLGDLRRGQLVDIDERRKNYGSLRGWAVALGLVLIGKAKPTSLAALRELAHQNDPIGGPDADTADVPK